jgi:DeoR family fructose operon transcriptional repressor
MKQSMIGAAQRTVLLVDHTKVGNDYLAKFASLSDISVLITDTGLDSGLAADLAAAGPEVVRV